MRICTPQTKTKFWRYGRNDEVLYKAIPSSSKSTCTSRLSSIPSKKCIDKTKKVNKKTRRSKKNQNVYKNLTIYYNNIRGIKSKLNSLTSIIEEQDPHFITINETHLGEEEKLPIEDNNTLNKYEFIYISVENSD